MGGLVVIVLVAVFLIAGFVLDLQMWPVPGGVVPYGLALGLGGLHWPLRIVLPLVGMVLGVSITEEVLTHSPLDYWAPPILEMTIAGGLAAYLSHHRHRSALQSQEAEASLSQLAKSKDLTERVIESTGNGILAYDSRALVYVVNRVLASWFALDPAAVIGRPIGEVVRLDFAPKLAQPARLIERLEEARLQPQAIIDEEYEQVSPARRFLRVYSAPVRLEGGAVAGRIVVATDLTEERRHEAEREALGRIAQALVHDLSLARVAEIITSEARHLLDADFTGLWLAEPDQRGFRLIAQRGLPPEENPSLNEMPLLLAEAIWSERTFEAEDAQILSIAFEPLRAWALRYGMRGIYAHPLILRGRLIGMLEIDKRISYRFTEDERDLIDALCDFSAAAIANAQLYDESLRRAHDAAEAHANLQRFLGMVSHDLRGPVSVVLGYTQLLLRHQPERTADREALQTMEDAARRMRRLIDDLLVAARIGSGRFAIEPAPMDLVTVARQVFEQQRASAPDHSFVFQAPPHLEGNWDAVRIGQLLTNLISNAVKYSSAGREVRLEITRQDGAARISVTDQGVGIAPEAIDQLFQPFWRISSDHSTIGSGLGLYISKGIVEAHHGQIGVKSSPGHGSTFWVRLPIE